MMAPFILWQRRELGHGKRQPFHAMARKVDLRAGIVAVAFQRRHRAFAKLGVKHFLLQLQAAGRRFCTGTGGAVYLE